MKTTCLTLASLTLFAAAAAAQNTRSSVQIDTGSPGPSFANAIASSGDLTVIAYVDGSDNTVNVSTSDGYAKSWSAPIRVDDDATAASKFSSAVTGNEANNLVISGTNVYLCWRDDRNAATTQSDIFFSRSTDSGATWSTNILIDKGTAAGVGDVRDWIMKVAPDAGGDKIYILISTDPTGSADEELYLTTSTDSGVTFGSAVGVTTINGTGVDIDDIGMAVAGPIVHVVWADERSGSSSNDDLFYAQSIDCGASFGTEVQINSSAFLVGDVESESHIQVDGSTLFVTFQEELTSTTVEELRGVISTDGGTTWGADFPIGGYVAGVDDVDNTWSAVNNGNLLVAWEDNRTGADEIYTATSTDGGISFSETTITTTGAGFPRFTANDGASPDVGLVFTSSTSPDNEAQASYSLDSGVTWKSVVTVSDDPANDVDFNEGAYNALYNNYIFCWEQDPTGLNNIFAGGFRPQTITANGFVVGGMANFDFTCFDGNESLAYICLSPTEGTWLLPFGDGRNTGLLLTPTLINALANSGAFQAVLAGGAGSTALIPNMLASGTTLYFIGVSFGIGPITPAEMTDVLEVTVP